MAYKIGKRKGENDNVSYFDYTQSLPFTLRNDLTMCSNEKIIHCKNFVHNFFYSQM